MVYIPNDAAFVTNVLFILIIICVANIPGYNAKYNAKTTDYISDAFWR